ncbi:hypothetical protein SARC_18231 [Sphaeroforma arctica JP610]|uniref:Uncharacterized protein n=1 Tax=Sphaeroforma arctica JP610 TaxID=667725 RepID=A0A0L0EXX8_9EUKA|nr:hypothetical protein SARC_18231 [Sphaeroforma arctica JP610]KNC69259.1 hypothetical protein SARC_18231 [Sphaeroforma arctica JP610]|eukprot:XP_014143161.1 hypothetical protein SARC_18231 [Sphaeroforma arctica JP610]
MTPQYTNFHKKHPKRSTFSRSPTQHTNTSIYTIATIYAYTTSKPPLNTTAQSTTYTNSTHLTTWHFNPSTFSRSPTLHTNTAVSVVGRMGVCGVPGRPALPPAIFRARLLSALRVATRRSYATLTP